MHFAVQMPFCFMSFYSADRQFYLADISQGLYSPSAYYAAMSASGLPLAFNLASLSDLL